MAGESTVGGNVFEYKIIVSSDMDLGGGMILPKKEEKSAGRSTEALRKTGIPGKSSGRF